MSGMVFVSKGFPPGSPGYKTLTSFVAMVVIVSTSSFVIFVAFEVCGHVFGAHLPDASGGGMWLDVLLVPVCAWGGGGGAARVTTVRGY